MEKKQRLLVAWFFLFQITCFPGWAVNMENLVFKQNKEFHRSLSYLLKAPEPPHIDGSLSEKWWRPAVVVEDFVLEHGIGKSRNKTALMAAYDDRSLYLAAVCSVKDIAKLVKNVPAGSQDKSIYLDDCIDFRLSPDWQKTVYQFLVNANGAREDMFNRKTEWDPPWQTAARIDQDCYIVEMSIPLKAIGMPEKAPGASMLFTFGRADRTLNELSTAFAPYADLEKAPLFILGAREDYAKVKKPGEIRKPVAAVLYLDRDQYPSFQKIATGRLRIDNLQLNEYEPGSLYLDLRLTQGKKPVFKKTVPAPETALVDFDLELAGLSPGEYELSASLRAPNTEIIHADRTFLIHPAQPEKSGKVAITVPATASSLPAWPLTFGVPFPWGGLYSPDQVKLVDAAGSEIPIQVKTTCLWSKKGSIRWLLLDCLSPVTKTEQKYTLLYGPQVRRMSVQSADLATQTDTEITIVTGPLKFAVSKGFPRGTVAVWLDMNGDGVFHQTEQFVKPEPLSGSYMVDEAGTNYWGSHDQEAEVVLEESGPLKACIRVSGWHVSDTGQKLGRHLVRYYAYRGLPYLRVFHTFIVTTTDETRYRDIGYTLPFVSSSYVMGTAGVECGKVAGSGAYLLQRDDLNYKIYENGLFKTDGARAEGWMCVGQPGGMLTVAVKDFWQQFPKEMEVTPTNLTIHAWPGHGEESTHPLSLFNVYRQWFFHEGKLLNFKLPEEVLPYLKKESEEAYREVKGANAMGLAKTHELLFYFHQKDWETARSRRVNQVFQDSPTGICSPEWVCRTKVFGNIHPRDPVRFPEIEMSLDERFQFYEQNRERDRDYGMFNFGDYHHGWNWPQRRWDLHRLPRNTHQGWQRWMWLGYARSGSKARLDSANRNARHIVDIDYCHFTTPELQGMGGSRAKYVGGGCTCTGFLHWSGGGLFNMDSSADALLWYYYLTGNELSRATALEHGAGLIADGTAWDGRMGAGRATSATALYFHTWDNDYLDFLERTVDKISQLGSLLTGGCPSGWENFAPYLQFYVDLTQSRRGMKRMERWADWLLENSRRPVEDWNIDLNILAHAYLYSGKEKYLQMAADRVNRTFNSYHGEDPRYEGMFLADFYDNWILQETPYYLSALAKLGHRPLPSPAENPVVIHALSKQPIEEKPRYVFRALIRQKRDEPFSLKPELFWTSSIWDPKEPVKMVTYLMYLRPIGAGKELRVVAQEQNMLHPKKTKIEMNVPADGVLDYELTICGDTPYFSLTLPVSAGQPDLKEIYLLSSFVNSQIGVRYGFKYYFTVPDKVQEITFQYGDGSWPTVFRVLDPQGKCVEEDMWVASNSYYRQLTVPVAKTGKGVWSFYALGYGGIGFHSVNLNPEQKGYEFHFATDPQKLFEPRRQ